MGMLTEPLHEGPWVWRGRIADWAQEEWQICRGEESDMAVSREMPALDQFSVLEHGLGPKGARLFSLEGGAGPAPRCDGGGTSHTYLVRAGQDRIRERRQSKSGRQSEKGGRGRGGRRVRRGEAVSQGEAEAEAEAEGKGQI